MLRLWDKQQSQRGILIKDIAEDASSFPGFVARNHEKTNSTKCRSSLKAK